MKGKNTYKVTVDLGFDLLTGLQGHQWDSHKTDGVLHQNTFGHQLVLSS